MCIYCVGHFITVRDGLPFYCSGPLMVPDEIPPANIYNETFHSGPNFLLMYFAFVVQLYVSLLLQ